MTKPSQGLGSRFTKVGFKDGKKELVKWAIKVFYLTLYSSFIFLKFSHQGVISLCHINWIGWLWNGTWVWRAIRVITLCITIRAKVDCPSHIRAYLDGNGDKWAMVNMCSDKYVRSVGDAIYDEWCIKAVLGERRKWYPEDMMAWIYCLDICCTACWIL